MPVFPTNGPITAEVTVASGAVEIVAEERTDVTVDVQPHDGRGESRSTADQTTVEMRGNTLVVTTPERSGFRLRNGSVSITIHLPLDSKAQVKSASAKVACHGRFAAVTADSASGDVYAEHVTGDVVFSTASGDMRAVTVGGHLRAKGASGDLTAHQITGSVAAKLASGDVEIEEAGADVRIDTASGDVSLGTTRQGTVRVGTVSGDVRVGVKAGTGVWLDVNTLSGRTSNGLDMGSGSGVAGQSGDGGQLTLQLRTVSGDISIHRA